MPKSKQKAQRAKSQEDSRAGPGTTNHYAAPSRNRGGRGRRNIAKRRERNSLVPINRLPTELLIAGFQASLEACLDYFKGLKNIASVA
ncbi:hypothetical protein FS837_000730 [Tulasnella sp. UAMH 9824]|nr:hypothetical protein FS837_000730 [Tulasnella sp. UAMH 9824]